MDVTVTDAVQLGFGFTVGALAALVVALPVMAFVAAFTVSLVRGVWNGARSLGTRKASSR